MQLTQNFKSTVGLLFALWKDAVDNDRIPQTVTLLGSPGIGKTSAARQLAKLMTDYMVAKGEANSAVCEVRDLSSSLPEDLGGLPYREGDTTLYAPQSMIKAVCVPEAYGVLVLDDLPAASTAVQVASRQISLEHRVHDHHISRRVMVIVTGNRKEDKSAASTLPAHFRNSVLMLTVEPSFDGWEEWAFENNMDSLIPQFLRFRPNYFSMLPKDADGNGSFATPRTWAMLGNALTVAKATDTLYAVASGLVGEGVTKELVAFDMLKSQLVSPDKVLADPQAALPDRSILNGPDKMIAMVCGLADAAIIKSKDSKTKGNTAYVQYLCALAWVTESNREYVATSISTFTAHKGNFKKLLDSVPEARAKEPRVTQMLAKLAECFQSSGGK
jgi:hypothetical protein